MSRSLKIVLRSRDLAAARRFYEDVLDLEPVDEWSEAHGAGCIYEVGEGMIELNEARGGDEASSPDRFDLQIKVDRLEPWTRRLEGRWDFTGPKQHPWGETTLRLRDPDGTLITIFSTDA